MLYHVSPIRNHTSIVKSGVDPALARSRFHASWWVTSEKLAWALAHCSVRHNVIVTDLEVWFKRPITFKRQTRTRWAGVYTSRCNNHPDGFMSAQEALEAMK